MKGPEPLFVGVLLVWGGVVVALFPRVSESTFEKVMPADGLLLHDGKVKVRVGVLEEVVVV